MYKLSKRSRGRLDGIDQILIDINEEGIKDSPFDYGIPGYGGLRTSEDQYKLYTDGLSNCDGYKKMSYHQSGKAFDIYAYVDGKASWETKHLLPIARHLQKVAMECFGVELEWGGEFLSRKQKRLSKEAQAALKEAGAGWDKPHLQYKG